MDKCNLRFKANYLGNKQIAFFRSVFSIFGGFLSSNRTKDKLVGLPATDFLTNNLYKKTPRMKIQKELVKIIKFNKI